MNIGYQNIVLIVVSVLSAFNLLLISVYGFLIKKNDKSFLWIGLMCLTISVAIIDNLLVYFNSVNLMLFHLSLFLNLSLGAFLFFFVSLFKNFKISKIHWLFFLPSILYVFIFISSVIFKNDSLWLSELFNHKPNSEINFAINYLIISYTLTVNLYLLFEEYFNNKTIKNDLFRKFRIEILITFLFFQTISFVPYLFIGMSWLQVFILPISALAFYLWTFFRLIRILDLLKSIPTLKRTANIFFSAKYKNQKICDEKQNEIANKIINYLETKKPYLEPKYSLVNLANEIGLSHHVVSMVINDKIGSSFHELLNKYRIDEAVFMILNENNPKIEAIAYCCGFGNKSSFYSAFKKQKNSLPKDFLKKYRPS